jgi:hypothetical protein
MVSPIVKPGPTVPLTVFTVAAELLLAAASAAKATAPASKVRLRILLLMPLSPSGTERVIAPRI